MKKSLFSLILILATAAHAEPLLIDLPTALRLADEKNTDLAIQIQRVTQAELDKSAAWYQWVPTLRIGASYGWQNGALQETDGTIIDEVLPPGYVLPTGRNRLCGGTSYRTIIGGLKESRAPRRIVRLAPQSRQG